MLSLDEGFSNKQGAAVKENLELAIPLWQYIQPNEIAEFVLFLASDDNQFKTGATQFYDGGMTIQ